MDGITDQEMPAPASTVCDLATLNAPPEDAKPFEEVMEEKGVKIFIDPKAILFLIGTEMDFVQEKLCSRFVFNNPNQTAACGCGESVSITPAQA